MRSNDMINFTDYRQNLRGHHARINETGRPLFVTNHGKPDAVIMPPKVYDELMDRAELSQIITMIERSEAGIAAGHATTDAREAIQQLAEKYGLTLER